MARYIEIESAIDELKNKDYIKLKSQEDRVRELFDLCPTVDVAPIIRGKWITIPIEQYSVKTRTYCSVCKQGQQRGHKKYCGYCGAKMEME